MLSMLLQSCLTLRDSMDIACWVSLSMGFSRQEYCSGLPCPSPGDLPDPGIEPASLMFPALAGGFFTTSTTWEAHCIIIKVHCVSSKASFYPVTNIGEGNGTPLQYSCLGNPRDRKA